tara:strand:- start:2686 stop:2985 length:300 start_codon:yes stop_codon:yes gene_type:complete
MRHAGNFKIGLTAFATYMVAAVQGVLILTVGKLAVVQLSTNAEHQRLDRLSRLASMQGRQYIFTTQLLIANATLLVVIPVAEYLYGLNCFMRLVVQKIG